jgi:hypothetical protein
MTISSTTRPLVLAAALAALMMAPSAPTAAAGRQMSVAARATTDAVKPSQQRVIRDHRRDARCKWTGRFYCSSKQLP